MTAPFRLENGAGVDLIGAVSLDSIEITELAPGGVSSMSFTIQDVAKARTVSRFERFLLINQVGADVTVFRGYATEVTARPLGLGREFEVNCVGPEILLDWLTAAPKSIGGLTNFNVAIQQLVTARTGGLNTAMGIGAERTGTAARPIGHWINPALGTVPFLTSGVAYTVPHGTLRYQVDQLHQMSAYDNAGTKLSFMHLLTIDHDLGLRSWEDFSGSMPVDWGSLIVVDSTAGTYLASGLEHTTDWSDTADNVRVIGTGVSGIVPGVAGLPQRDILLDDPDITTATQRDIAANNVLLRHDAEQRGTLRIEDFDPPLIIHAGSILTLTDTNVGVAAVSYRIAEIVKRFHGNGRQDWQVSYGKPQKSAMRRIRSATRGTW